MSEDFSEAFAAFDPQTYTVKRKGLGSYDAGGVYTEDSGTTLEVQGIAVPLSGRELERLPEAMRTKENRRFFTQADLNSLSAGGVPDVVVIDGEDWEVSIELSWKTIGGFEEFVLTRVTPPDAGGGSGPGAPPGGPPAGP